jgi:hypothetical protein
MTEENGTKHVALQTEQPQQQTMQLQMQLTPQGVMLQFPVNLGLDNDMMKQLIKQYLTLHPELVQEIAKEALQQKQQEIRFLQLVKQSRTD